ncbi:MAG TPA: LuxR C-terminal-related transcriptional regulator [Propionibacteriaceae bacterium]|nr:LuxR C-terminal-related transcriptional regulator [Propionibacteriaceae bacterium]
MGSYANERAAKRIAELRGRGLDLVTFWCEARDAIASAVPYYITPCWFTLDPTSLLVTSHHDHGYLGEFPAEWLAHEYYEDDFHSLADIARSKAGISTLHEVTDGDPSRSRAWRESLQPYGVEQGLGLALRTPAGEAWGVLTLYRAPGQPIFTPEERQLLLAIAPHLAEGVRRGLLVGEASDPERPDAPGLVVLGADWTVETLTPGVEHWLRELPGEWAARGKLPPAVLAVAGRALRTAESKDDPGEVALARVLSNEGRWIMLHGASLVADGARRTAVIIEPAHPARISPLLMSAYGLTEREQEVTRLVLRGDSTVQIADELFVSAHTVQQHLKRVFEKTGVRSRRDLVGKVFFAHYEPRFRDNERRAINGQPVRGGPMEVAAAK